MLALTRSSSETRKEPRKRSWEDSRPGKRGSLYRRMAMPDRPSNVGILAMEVYLPGQKVWASPCTVHRSAVHRAEG